MIVGASTEGPEVLAIRFLDRQIVDAGITPAHQSVVVEFPVLVSVRAKPILRVVVPLICEAHGDAISVEGPQLLDEPVVEFFRPLAFEKPDDLRAAVGKLSAVSPT